MSLQIRLKREDRWPLDPSFPVIVFDGAGDGVRTTSLHVSHEPTTEPMGETLQIDQKGAQRLFDDLWAVGLRPSEENPVAGIVDAQRAHIEDLSSAVMSVLSKT